MNQLPALLVDIPLIPAFFSPDHEVAWFIFFAAAALLLIVVAIIFNRRKKK
jgi:LPXTG-motif cell wall-anchored protein